MDSGVSPLDEQLSGGVCVCVGPSGDSCADGEGAEDDEGTRSLDRDLGTPWRSLGVL